MTGPGDAPPTSGTIEGGALARFLKSAGQAHLYGEVAVTIDGETTHLVVIDGGLAVRTSTETGGDILVRVIHRLLRSPEGTWVCEPLRNIGAAHRLRTEPLDQLVVDALLRRASRQLDGEEATRTLPRYDDLGPLVPIAANPAPPAAAVTPPTPAPTPTPAAAVTPPTTPPAPTPAAAPPVTEPAITAAQQPSTPAPRPLAQARPVNPRLEMEQKRLAGFGTEMKAPQRRREDRDDFTPAEQAARQARVDELRARRATQLRFSLRGQAAAPSPTRQAPMAAAPNSPIGDTPASPTAPSSPPPTRRRALRNLIRTLATETDEG